MKLIHAQIYGALVSLLLVGALLWGVNLRSAIKAADRDAKALERKLEQAEKARAHSAAKAQAAPAAAGPAEIEAQALRAALAAVERERDHLKLERDTLKVTLQKALDGGAATQLGGLPPSPAMPSGASNAWGAGAPTGPPPVVAPPPAPRSEPWGASQPDEIARMADYVGFTPEQSTMARDIIMDSQNEFERRLIEISQRGGGDPSILGQIGAEVAKKAEQRMRQICLPDQVEKFEKYMETLRDDPTGAGLQR